MLDEIHGPFVLERSRRFSESFLWSLQRRFYETQGREAWGDGGVPHAITTNRFIARAYARVVRAWGHDLGIGPKSEAPLHLIELGAGLGRFAFHFLSAWVSDPQAPPLRYVMTDFAESNLAAWCRSEPLRPFVESGALDFALFDAANQGPLRLAVSGEELGPRSLSLPPVIVANYVLDSLPHDIYSVRASMQVPGQASARASVRVGELLDTRVTVHSEKEAPLDLQQLDRLTLSFEHHPLSAPPYDDPDANAVLEEYRQRLGEASFLFPCAAFRTLRVLADLASGRLFLLAADRGYDRLDDLLSQTGPAIAAHGSVSVPVNFHALGAWFRRQGGRVLRSGRRHPLLAVSAFALGGGLEERSQTVRAFEEMAAQGHPEDYHRLLAALERVQEQLSLAEILSAVRLVGSDPGAWLAFFPAFLAIDPAALPPALREELVLGLLALRQGSFGEEADPRLASGLATLLQRLGLKGNEGSEPDDAG